MRNNQSRITAAVLLTVLVCTFFIIAGQKLLRPDVPITPTGGNPIIRLTKDSGKESKGIFRRKSKNKDERAESAELSAELNARLSAESDESKIGENKKLSAENGVNSERLRKESREKIRKNSAEKPRKDRCENSGSYNNRGGKCPDYDNCKGEK